MAPNPSRQDSGEDEGLPLDLRTLLLGLWRRRRLAAGLVLLSAILGVAVALVLGERVWTAETVLLHQPRHLDLGEDGYRSLSLQTQADMVKVQTNLSEVRRRLGLSSTLARLGAATEVEVLRHTSLFAIRASWSDRDRAAAIASTLRDVFLENQQRIGRAERARQTQFLVGRMEVLRAELVEAEERLEEFRDENDVVDVEQEAEWVLQEMTSIEVLSNEAELERRSLDTQLLNVREIIARLQNRVEEERASPAEMDALGNLNARINQLRGMIRDSQEIRSWNADMVQKQLELERQKRLLAKDAASQKDVERAEADYDKAKALAVDTDETRQWREEMEQLRTTAALVTTNAAILQDMIVKELDLHLDLVSVEEKKKHLDSAREETLKKLEDLPQLERKYVSLSRSVSSRDLELHRLGAMVARLRRDQELEPVEFAVVTEATPPVFPTRANRRKLCMAVTAMLGLLSLGLLAGLEVLDPRVRSAAELALKLPIPSLGAIPKVSPAPGIVEARERPEIMEPCRIIARQIRNKLAKPGARILITSAVFGEGRTTLSATLAACFGGWEERVLVVDGQVRAREEAAELRGLIKRSVTSPKGLGDYLGQQTVLGEEVLSPTVLAGVDCIPRARHPVSPDLLASKRLGELMGDLSKWYGLVVVDGPPVLPHVDADLLAKWSDGIVLVVKSSSTRLASVKKAVERLEGSGAPVLGVILNEVHPIFMEKV